MDTSSIQENIIKNIENGSVGMRPRWQFVLKAALFFTACIIIVLLALYLVSFSLFALWYTGSWYVTAFGLRGVMSFLISLPWLFIIAICGFIVILEFFVTKYEFVYRRPRLYSLLVLLFLAMLGGTIIARTSLHTWLLKRTEKKPFPIVGSLYRNLGERRPRDIYLGEIKTFTKNGFVLGDRSKETMQIFILPETRLPYGAGFATSDRVVVMGRRENGLVSAFGILKLNDGEYSE